ncbi:MAG TPA: hypothetical protein VHO69_08935 [Phototrophicaceae bacterium]|nr:hypothetical protein [Phototrophicaceae bacterium]
MLYYVESKQAQEFDLPEVTHQRWNGLSAAEKEQLVLAELRRWLPEL